MKLHRGLAAAALVLLPLTACGDDGGGDGEKQTEEMSAEDKKAAESVAEGLNTSEDTAPEEADRQCIGEGMVQELGRDKLVEYKIIDEDLEPVEGGAEDFSTEDGEATAQVFLDCTDVKELVTSGAPEESKDCLDEQLTDDVLRDFLAKNFAGDDSASQVLDEAAGECIQPQQQPQTP